MDITGAEYRSSRGSALYNGEQTIVRVTSGRADVVWQGCHLHRECGSPKHEHPRLNKQGAVPQVWVSASVKVKFATPFHALKKLFAFRYVSSMLPLFNLIYTENRLVTAGEKIYHNTRTHWRRANLIVKQKAFIVNSCPGSLTLRDKYMVCVFFLFSCQLASTFSGEDVFGVRSPILCRWFRLILAHLSTDS